MLGDSASGGSAGFLGVWNAYNRVSVSAASIDIAAPLFGLHVFSANQQDDGTNANNFNVAAQNAFSGLARM